MYFSGQMIDNYSKSIENLEIDKTSEILLSLSDEADEQGRKYSDKQSVTVAGIITAKKTKVTKNGDTMAFITVEDSYGELEVIVFARQYKRFSSDIIPENAVLVKGTLSFEDGDEIRILLSELTPLKSNTEYENEARSAQKEQKPSAPEAQTLYVKLDSIMDKRVATITRMALLNPGKAKVVVYDASSGKYSAMKDAFIDPTEKVMMRLKSLFGDKNVVLK